MKLTKRFVACMLVCILLGTQFLYVEASSIGTLQQQIEQNKNQLGQVNQQIDEYQAQLEAYEMYLDDMKSEMMNLMKDIVYYEEAIFLKEADILQATEELAVANQLREQQYEAMKVHIQYMYESGSADNYLLLLLSSEDMADLLNRAEYVDSLYTYDSNVLTNYEKLVQEVDLMRENLEVEKTDLVAHQEMLSSQKVELDRVMEELEEQISDYDDLVEKAKAKAKKYKDQIAKDQQKITEIKKKQEEERKRKEEEEKKRQEEALKAQQNAAANNGGGSSGSSGTVSGTGTGAEIAQFALQFVGNPYVWAGTSLTNGADCSGFIMSVYANFGYSLPHSSYSMRSIGTGVDLANAQAGDIICYSGHVGLYIGNGQIVHAKSSKYGIVTDPVYYGWGGTGPKVLAVRRIIN